MLDRLCRGGLAVKAEGRVWLCRKPTVETVLTFLRLFQRETMVAYEAVKKGEPADTVADLILGLCLARPLDLASVLVTCCEGGEGAARDLGLLSPQPVALRSCALAVLQQTDVAEIVEGEGVARACDRTHRALYGEPSPYTPVEPGPEVEGRAILMLCRATGLPPDALPRLPYDAFTALCRAATPDAQGEDQGAVADPSTLPGVRVVNPGDADA